MLELATLGFLQKQPLHGYRLKQQLELFMSGCISVNYGAIYPMLKRIEARGDIVIGFEPQGLLHYGCRARSLAAQNAGISA
jgi:DNA-binding PadR family transcriptional regulator